MLAIVILNYNTWTETCDCIQSIKCYAPSHNYKIYVVDNASSEKIPPHIYESINGDEKIELLWNCDNKGYAAGNNVGIKKALEDNCSCCLICNSDVRFVDDSINKMCFFQHTTTDAGIIGPQIYDVNGRFQPFYMMCKLTGIGKLKNMALHTPFRVFFKDFEHRFILKHEIDSPQKVFGVSGCCFLISRECLDYLYPLDENTFLYEEEYIIGVRIEKSPYNAYIIPNTHVIHAHGASTGGMNEFSYNCLIKSEQYYLKEYINEIIFVRYIILIIRLLLRHFIVKRKLK